MYNETTIIQTLVVEDNVAPIWLSEPDQFVVTDDFDAGGFQIPVAQDDCSDFQIDLNVTYEEGACPLAQVLTRTFVATDECGNVSTEWVQTITESTDLRPVSNLTPSVAMVVLTAVPQ